MATIILRQGVGGKGSPLTNAEVDANFTNLNTDKVETADAVSTNTANKVVKRDGSGNFSAGTITATFSGDLTGDVTGNSSTATLATAATNVDGGAAGSVPYQSAIDTTSFVAPGSSGQIFVSNGTNPPGWVTPALIDVGSVDGKSFGTFTAAGGILYATSTSAAAAIGTGTVGQLLKSNGTSAPSWETVVPGVSSTDDTSTNTSYYPALLTTVSGAHTAVKVSSTKLYFNPNTGTLNATIFNSLSDATQKINVTPITDATGTLQQIQSVEFDWKDTNNHSAGVIAQQLETILPFLVVTDNNGVKSVNYSGLIAYLIQSNKELAARVDALEAK